MVVLDEVKSILNTFDKLQGLKVLYTKLYFFKQMHFRLFLNILTKKILKIQ
jgi:hypothetical protein